MCTKCRKSHCPTDLQEKWLLKCLHCSSCRWWSKVLNTCLKYRLSTNASCLFSNSTKSAIHTQEASRNAPEYWPSYSLSHQTLQLLSFEMVTRNIFLRLNYAKVGYFVILLQSWEHEGAKRHVLLDARKNEHAGVSFMVLVRASSARNLGEDAPSRVTYRRSLAQLVRVRITIAIFIPREGVWIKNRSAISANQSGTDAYTKKYGTTCTICVALLHAQLINIDSLLSIFHVTSHLTSTTFNGITTNHISAPLDCNWTFVILSANEKCD